MTKLQSWLMLARAFNQKYTETDDAFLVWLMESFADVTDAELEKAIRRIVLTSKFMPSIAEVRDLVLDDRAAHPVPTKTKQMTRESWWESCVQQDMGDMGMNAEEYAAFKEQHRIDNGEDWVPPGWNPEAWNEDGTRKGFDDAAAKV
jgi:hypothetical protein